MSESGIIRVIGARQNNLKNINVDIPLNKLIVVTGISGSGKTSLAFDTLYAEGQRRYAETFSPYTRQFLERLNKPQVDSITGIPPAIAIGQANNVKTSRSTVGTMTEIADHLKLLFPSMASLTCPHCKREIKQWNADGISRELLRLHKGSTVTTFFDVPFPAKTKWHEVATFLTTQGFSRILLGEKVHRLDEASAPAHLDSLKLGDTFVIHVAHDRITIDSTNIPRLSESIAACLNFGKGVVGIHSTGESPLFYSNRWHCPYDHVDFETPTPAMFAFNSPVGACPACRGFGRTIEIDYQLAIPDPALSLRNGAVKPWQTPSFDECQKDLVRSCKRVGVSLDTPFSELSRKDRDFVIFGEISQYKSLEELWESGGWYGIKGFFDWLETKTYKMHVRILLSRYRAYRKCVTCDGSRFQEKVHNWRINGKTLPEVNLLPVSELVPFFNSLTPHDESQEIILDQIRARLGFLEKVGLGYITLDRTTRTLSGGEFQRVNLTTCLGTSLVGTLFVLDEPSIGLHPRDTKLLINILHSLRNQQNTIIVVEHDENVMLAADHILELGPLQGEKGGSITFEGSPEKLIRSATSITGKFLAHKEIIPRTEPRAISPKTPRLSFKGVSKHNITNLDFSFPLGKLVIVTGVSGSGKSTLVHEIVQKGLLLAKNRPVDEPPQLESITGHERISDVILVDQSPLSLTPRSTPVLYLDAYDAVRELFGTTDLALQSGLSSSSFSFNSGNGRCERCQGTGFEKVSMQFLSDLYIQCPICEGKRFQPHVLNIRYEGKNIDEILRSSVDEALDFFNPEGKTGRHHTLHSKIHSAISLLKEVGLGYIQLGQPLNQLSGGEAQRLKLVSHLAESLNGKVRSDKNKLIILDEPTTGLHLADIRILINALNRLVDEGHSLLVIEHHLDVIKCADWIIDMGPEAGDEGGKIIAIGTPAQIAKNPSSITGRFLKPKLKGTEAQVATIPPAKLPKISSDLICIRGARHHNLKNISIDIPRNKMVVVTGLSGSGKSTLAFDLLFGEGQRRYLDCLNTYARQFVERMERPQVDSITGIPPAVAIEQRTSRGGGKSTVATITEIYQFMRLLYSKLGVQHDPDTQEPARRQTYEEILQGTRDLLGQEKTLQLFAPLVRGRKGFHTEVAKWAERHNYEYLRVNGKIVEVIRFKALDRYKEHHIELLVGEISLKNKDWEIMLRDGLHRGNGTIYLVNSKGKQYTQSTEWFCPTSGRSFEPLDPRMFSFNSPHGWCPECQGFGTIVQLNTDAETEVERELQIEQQRENLEDGEEVLCPSCKGSRLNPEACAVRFGNLPVPQINAMPIREFETFFSKLKLDRRAQIIARDIRPEIEQRIRFLKRVGLDYLSLDRSATTLSGGEAQRIRLAAQLGSNLQGVLYVLDEPTIGLHPRDNENLLIALRELQSRGNSLLIVEHDEDTMKQSDYLIDLGPGAGINGGEIVAKGSWKDVAKSKISPTALLLGEPLVHPMQGQRRPITPKTPSIRVEGAVANNLKKVSFCIPHGRLTVITGVSGSGKSTLMHDVLVPAVSYQKNKSHSPKTWSKISGHESVERIIEVNQSPIGKTSRSTLATYVGIMDIIRDLFAKLPESKANGFTRSHFSHNNGEGRCPECKGQGTVCVEMNFLPPTFVPCDVCEGKRWTQRILDIKYKDKNILEVLQLSVDEAVEFFGSVPNLSLTLKLLNETGLGYLTLGQTSPTLSGGEAQRIKLVTELAQAAVSEQKRLLKSRAQLVSHYLYILEEPSVGLHLADVKRLISIVHQLVDKGHTVVVVEHHLDLIAEADHIIDLGPESGEKGGSILFEGTPEKLLSCRKSHTARFLAPILNRKPAKSLKNDKKLVAPIFCEQ